jgi:4-diphosphocytidyl-2-C-methyl-D-erythritol kinase
VKAFAKVNLALVVGSPRDDGKHEVATVLQAIDLHDDVELEPHGELVVEGFAEDTLVRDGLAALASEAGVDPAWRVRIEKRIPVAAGLGGGSSDAAAALALANTGLAQPLDDERLHGLAAGLGADVPFFLARGPQLGTGDGSTLEPISLPDDYVVLLALPEGAAKVSTAAVYARFDERDGAAGFAQRRAELLDRLGRVRQAADLAALPANDLVSAPLARRLERLGAFRADVSGAGPAVYGLFERPGDAERAASALGGTARTWVTSPALGNDRSRMAR